MVDNIVFNLLAAHDISVFTWRSVRKLDVFEISLVKISRFDQAKSFFGRGEEIIGVLRGYDLEHRAAFNGRFHPFGLVFFYHSVDRFTVRITGLDKQGQGWV